MDERKKLDELTEEGNCKCAQFCQEQQDSNQCNSLQLSELRTWYLGNPCWTLDFFEGYKWLEKGIEEGDLDLRKFCMNRLHGIFSTPQDALEWVKNGTIPSYLK
jgi:hypothetical protein